MYLDLSSYFADRSQVDLPTGRVLVAGVSRATGPSGCRIPIEPYYIYDVVDGSCTRGNRATSWGTCILSNMISVVAYTINITYTIPTYINIQTVPTAYAQNYNLTNNNYI